VFSAGGTSGHEVGWAIARTAIPMLAGIPGLGDQTTGDPVEMECADSDQLPGRSHTAVDALKVR
jgi:hypothetical protein